MRLPRLCCFAASVCGSAALPAASFDDRVESLFRPALGETMALSPDGLRVAYTSQRGRDLSLVLLNLDHPGARQTVKVEPDRETPPAAEEPPARLRFLRWATPTRLVFAPVERIVPLPPVPGDNGRLLPNPDGPTVISPVFAVDADGRHRGTVIDARHFQETPAEARKTLADLLRTTQELQSTRSEAVRWRMPHLDILGFFPRDREQLIIHTRGAYSVPTQHLVDIRTGTVREFGVEWPAPPGEPQVYDAFRLKVVGERQLAVHPRTLWRDDDLARIQRELEAKFPRRTVELLDWSDHRARILCRVTGGSDPGRIFVYQRPEDVVVEILRRAPWLTAARLHETRFFEFNTPDGATLTGYLTSPRQPRISPPPLLVVFPSGFPGRAQPAFDPESQVFADQGFVVARLNHRAVGGVRREDLPALREAVDRVSIEDARLAVEWLSALNPARPFDRKRVVALGHGFGGYLALRALQLEPTVFRCGVSLDGALDPQLWLPPGGPAPAEAPRPVPAEVFAAGAPDPRKLSVVEDAAALAHPVLLAHETSRPSPAATAAGELRTRLDALGRTCVQVELDAGFAAAHPAARARVYRRLEEFFNLHLHQFTVKIGPAREVQ